MVAIFSLKKTVPTKSFTFTMNSYFANSKPREKKSSSSNTTMTCKQKIKTKKRLSRTVWKKLLYTRRSAFKSGCFQKNENNSNKSTYPAKAVMTAGLCLKQTTCK